LFSVFLGIQSKVLRDGGSAVYQRRAAVAAGLGVEAKAGVELGGAQYRRGPRVVVAGAATTRWAP